jgi:hypothetical protein
MDIHEQIAFQLAKERMEDALRDAQERRAIRLARPRRSARVRLGSALVRLGHWIARRQPSQAPPTLALERDVP